MNGFGDRQVSQFPHIPVACQVEESNLRGHSRPMVLQTTAIPFCQPGAANICNQTKRIQLSNNEAKPCGRLDYQEKGAGKVSNSLLESCPLLKSRFGGFYVCEILGAGFRSRWLPNASIIGEQGFYCSITGKGIQADYGVIR
jgi:hypothetical protein